MHANPVDPLFLAFADQVLHNEGISFQETAVDASMKHWVGLWDHLDGNFWGTWQWAADHLSPRLPVPQVASIGWNLHHLGEMLDLYLTRGFQVRQQIQLSPLLTMQSASLDDGRYQVF